ncbi:alpha/beta hydrolase [Actinacidiphila rubida]|uniref:Enterochelin esterase n=1 Tax=Actinacidiphila rubida TaxID=310780 RepID=A0A1H8TN77_9ACTN|nr:alpha/beta hydrolase-fold protein [Actinacidiphila rubida]SEO92286.1 Enterochelin esterase [Actinacidiphila rubida]
MSLTGTALFVLSILLVPVVMVLMLLAWNRLPGPYGVRIAGRLGMVVVSQAAAVLAVLIWVNNTYGLYESWSDLMGDNGQVQLNAAGPGNAGVPADPTAARQADFVPGKDGVLTAMVTGPRSHITGNVLVWLPPQYGQPAYRHARFPVVELLPGYPGSPGAWFGAMGAGREMASLIEQRKVAPMILVAPKMNVLGRVDPGCADLPHGAHTSTWLGADVPDLVTHRFRAEPGPHHWAIMGYSAGAYCAANTALHHPRAFHAVVSLSGYNAPEAGLVTRDPALARANNPYLELHNAKRQPDIVLLMAGSYQDSDTVFAARALLSTLHHPGESRLLTIQRGGHNTQVWRSMLPTALTWISQQIAPTRA